jgi:hypothetical protein
MTKPTLTDLEIRHVLADMDLLNTRAEIPGGWHLDILQSGMKKLQQRALARETGEPS